MAIGDDVRWEEKVEVLVCLGKNVLGCPSVILFCGKQWQWGWARYCAVVGHFQ